MTIILQQDKINVHYNKSTNTNNVHCLTVQVYIHVCRLLNMSINLFFIYQAKKKKKRKERSLRRRNTITITKRG